MRLFFFTTIILYGAFACKTSKPGINSSELSSFKTRTYYIAPYQVACSGAGEQKCFLIKHKTGDQWKNFYSQIEGFNFEPGYSYIIKIKESEVSNPPADASSINYQLEEIIEKQHISQPTNSLYDIWGILSVNDVKLKDKGILQMMEINTSKNEVMGKGTCNEFSANLILKEGSNSFKIQEFNASEAYCDTKKYEDDYFKTLKQADAFYRYNNRLLLISNNKVVIEAIKMD